MTAVDYPLPIWRHWSSGNHNQTDRREAFESHPTTSSPTEISYKLFEEKNEPSPRAYLFVLFVKLPNWKSKESRESTPEIRTLRNLKNGMEVYRVKAALELSTGLPAHITTLLDVKDKKFTDDSRLVIGENIRSGNSLRLKVISAWEDVVRAAWIDNLPDLLANLPSNKSQKESLASSEYEQFASVVAKSGNEHAFCALFTAATRGNLDICKAILEAGYDPNQATYFGNTALHSAAFNGQFEVIQLLISHDANTRCINSHKKTPLDLAASRGFIDCARWLWLNQWSVKVPPSEGKVPETESTSKSPYPYPSPSKPLKDCSTFFTKPTKSILLPVETIKPKSSSHAKSSLESRDYNSTKSRERPQSIPLSWKVNKADNRVSFAKNEQDKRSEAFRVYAETKRPFTAVAKKGDSDLSPRLLPQLSASFARGRSIPSIQETRHHSYTKAHLRVDVRSRSVVKPLTVDMSLHRHWVNPVQSSSQLSLSPEEPIKKTPRQSGDIKNPISTKPKTSSHVLPFSNLNSNKEKEKLKRQHTENDKTAEQRVSSKIDDVIIPLQNDEIEKAEPKINVQVHFASRLPESEKPALLVKEELNLSEKPTFFTKNETLKRKKSEASKTTSEKTVEQNTIPQKPIDNVKTISTKKTSLNMLNSYDSLHGHSNNNLPIVNTAKEKKIRPNSVARVGKSNFPQETIEHPVTTSLPPNPSKVSQAKPTQLLVKEKVYDQYKRADTNAESQHKQALSRNESIRKERNKTAWMEWMAAKHKNATMHKKKTEEAKKQHDHAVKKWGMTFDEWLAEKRKEPEKKTDETEIAKPNVKRPHTVSGGKTFDKWLKEKKDDKPREFKSAQKTSEEEIKKAEETRQRRFALWSAKKLEDAKKEKETREREEEKKRSSLTSMHEKWRSKERVMPFEAWKKKKENARKLKMVDEAQDEEKEYLAVWTAEQRREDAEKAFRKWMNKKHTVLLREAATELEEAKQKREDTEKKMRIRRALLRAKVLLRWKKMSEHSKLQNRKKSDRLNSTSLSTGDIADVTDDVSFQEFPKPHSEDEGENFQPNSNFHDFSSLVMKMDPNSSGNLSKPLKRKSTKTTNKLASVCNGKDTVDTPAKALTIKLAEESASSSSSSSDSDNPNTSTDQKLPKKTKKVKKLAKKKTNHKKASKNTAPSFDNVSNPTGKSGRSSLSETPPKKHLDTQAYQTKPQDNEMESHKSSITLKRTKSASTERVKAKITQRENVANSSPYTTSLDHKKSTAKAKIESKKILLNKATPRKDESNVKATFKETKFDQIIKETASAQQAYKKYEHVHKNNYKNPKKVKQTSHNNLTNTVNKSNEPISKDNLKSKVSVEKLATLDSNTQQNNNKDPISSKKSQSSAPEINDTENFQNPNADITEKSKSPIDMNIHNESKGEAKQAFNGIPEIVNQHNQLGSQAKILLPQNLQNDARTITESESETVDVFRVGDRDEEPSHFNMGVNGKLPKSRPIMSGHQNNSVDGEVSIVTDNVQISENKASFEPDAKNKSPPQLQESSNSKSLSPNSESIPNGDKNQDEKLTPSNGPEKSASEVTVDTNAVSYAKSLDDNMNKIKNKQKTAHMNSNKEIHKENATLKHQRSSSKEKKSQPLANGRNSAQKHVQSRRKDDASANVTKARETNKNDKRKQLVPVDDKTKENHKDEEKKDRKSSFDLRKASISEDSIQKKIQHFTADVADESKVLADSNLNSNSNLDVTQPTSKTLAANDGSRIKSKEAIPEHVEDDRRNLNEVDLHHISYVEASGSEKKQTHLKPEINETSDNSINAGSANHKDDTGGVPRTHDAHIPKDGESEDVNSLDKKDRSLIRKDSADTKRLPGPQQQPSDANPLSSNYESVSQKSNDEFEKLESKNRTDKLEDQAAMVTSTTPTNSQSEVTENNKNTQKTTLKDPHDENKEKMIKHQHKQNPPKEKRSQRASSVKKSPRMQSTANETYVDAIKSSPEPANDVPSFEPPAPYSLVQAALDFIKAEENRIKEIPENSEGVKRRKITIEMPIAQMDNDSDSSNA